MCHFLSCRNSKIANFAPGLWFDKDLGSEGAVRDFQCFINVAIFISAVFTG